MDMPLTEVKARLSEIVERIEAGEAIRITKYGRPVVEMRRVEPTEAEEQAQRDYAWKLIDELRATLPEGTRTPEEIKAYTREELE